MSVYQLNKVAESVAAADGTILFRFDPPAIGESWQGSLSVTTPNQPPSSAKFTATVSGRPWGSWVGINIFPAIQAFQKDLLVVTGTGLIPGLTYDCLWAGTITNGTDIPPPITPTATVASVQNSTEQLLLAGPLTASPGAQYVITLDPAWRSIWVVTDETGTPTLVGNQSGLASAPFTPPYFESPGNFYRFPVVVGVDVDVTLTIESSGSAWYGADLADIDTVSYTTSGGSGGMAYASLTGPGETATPGDLTQAGGFTVDDSASHGITLESVNGPITLETSAGDPGIVITSPYLIEITATDPANGHLQLTGAEELYLTSARVNVQGELAQGSGHVGFFGVSPVAQQPTPVTLADVITLLQAYGLSA